MAVPQDLDGLAKIKVVGVGGGGCNAIARMAREQIEGVELIAVNTDAQALMQSEVPLRIRIGDEITRGLGVGGDPEIGREAAEESREDIKNAIQGSDMVFIAAGMGGGTGTGAAPVIAECAREAGALTVAVVTEPFLFEGTKRTKNATTGLDLLKQHVDTLLVVPNDRLMEVAGDDVPWQEAFKMVDDVLHQGILSIVELVTVAGDINLDFADVKSVMSNSGQALMAIGRATGEHRAIEAARSAIANPLLDLDIRGAKGVLFNVTGGTDLKLAEVNAAAEMIREAIDPDANIIIGFVTDVKMEGEVKITIIATGFDQQDGNSPEDKVDEMLAAALSEDLDIPPFMRRKAGQKNGTGRLSGF
jgi:cell division protein FtsZ